MDRQGQGPVATATQLVRQGNLAGASALFETQIETGKDRDTRDRAIAEEWLSVAIHFFNVRETGNAQAAVVQAASLADGLNRRKGVDPEYYYFYRNLGSAIESILRDRTIALAYYQLALNAAPSNPKVPIAEVDQLRRKMAKTSADDAVVKGK